MAKIRNSSMRNWYGDGQQQIFTNDDGKEYVIRNSAMDNWYGEGKQLIVEEKNKSADWPFACNGILMTILIVSAIIALVQVISGDSVSIWCMIAFVVSFILDAILGLFTIGH